MENCEQLVNTSSKHHGKGCIASFQAGLDVDLRHVSQRFESCKDGRTFTKTKSKGRLSIASTDSTRAA